MVSAGGGVGRGAGLGVGKGVSAGLGVAVGVRPVGAEAKADVADVVGSVV